MESSATGAGESVSRSPVDSFLDAGACLALLGNLYPLSVSMLFFQLESFLKRADSDSLTETSLPRRLLEQNRLQGRRLRQDGRLDELLDLGTDILVTHDASEQSTAIKFVRADRSRGLRGDHLGVRLRILLAGDDKVDRFVSLPLQPLMTDWGPLDGYQGFRHTLDFRLPDGLSLEQWHFVGIARDHWLVRMDEHDQAVRAGTNRKFSAAWRAYTGAAHVVMASELVRLGASEDDILAWEEEEVDRCVEAGNCLNLAPGGLKGMQHLHFQGAIPQSRVPVADRDAALEAWAHRADSAPFVARVPHMLGIQWSDNGFHLKFAATQGQHLTPNQVIEIQRLAGDRQDPAIIAAAVGTSHIELVQRILADQSLPSAGTRAP